MGNGNRKGAPPLWRLARLRKIAEHLGRPNFKLYRQYLNEGGGMDALAEALEGADAVINLAAICNPSQDNTRPLATIRSNCFDIYPVIDMCAARRVWFALASYVGDTYAIRTCTSLTRTGLP